MAAKRVARIDGRQQRGGSSLRHALPRNRDDDEIERAARCRPPVASPWRRSASVHDFCNRRFQMNRRAALSQPAGDSMIIKLARAKRVAPAHREALWMGQESIDENFASRSERSAVERFGQRR